jgi:P27 family predicted phage terminase small subunit
VHLKILRGNPGQRRLRPEPEPAIEPACPEPPSYVTGHAAEEWRNVAPELFRMRMLTRVDTACLAAYCTSYARWRLALELLTREAANDPATRGLTVKVRDGSHRRSPLVKIARDAASDMLLYAREFGLTAAARSRLAGAGWVPPDKPSKFAGLLGPRDAGA